MFNQESYKKHYHWYNHKFPTEESKANYLKSLQSRNDLTIGKWLQDLFFKCLDPILNHENNTWLTIGDAYGFDAQYILSKRGKAVASDLNTDFLKAANRERIIGDFCSQNAEALNYADNCFDYILCKESFHHFPRPYSALYEMVRVAKKGFLLMEPQDPILKMPALLALMNIFSRVNKGLAQKLWKNRFSYEPVGNFVYKVSERELEKFAAGLNLPLVAFKNVNPNFYFDGANYISASKTSKLFLGIYLKKKILDFSVKMGIVPAQVLVAIIFKSIPNKELIVALKREGYKLTNIPKNPYL